jgi:hypothetical protein
MIRSIFLTVLLTVGAFSAVFYSGCTKDDATDKCASVSCVYGTCVNGTCICNTGYTGSRCDKKLCEANNTAKVRFINKTGSSLTYSVVWDGSTLTTLGPGQTSEYYEVAAGEHKLHFMIANGGEACTESSPVLAQCSSMEYWCTK